MIVMEDIDLGYDAYHARQFFSEGKVFTRYTLEKSVQVVFIYFCITLISIILFHAFWDLGLAVQIRTSGEVIR